MSKLITLSELFNNKIFRIPDYQRGYAWGKNQLQDFWEDIINLPSNHYHYTGMISLKELERDIVDKWEEDDNWIIKNKNYKAFHVIDGQQRLTTFIILLKVLIDFSKEKGIDYIVEDSIDEIVGKYFYEWNKNKVLKAYKFGYEKDNPSFEFLKQYIIENEQVSSLEKTFYTLNLDYSKKYFVNKLNEAYLIDETIIEQVFKKITTQLHFNIHEIESDFDVNVAFETMNNRGKKLSNLEILKNRLIYLSTIYDDKVLNQKEKNKIRRIINNSWKEVYKQLGSNPNDPLNDDEYLRNHWYMYFKYSRTKGSDYIDYLLKVFFTIRAVQGKTRELLTYNEYQEEDDQPEDFIDVIADDSILHYQEILDYSINLSKLSSFWFYSYNPDRAFELGLTDLEIKLLTRLNRVNIGYFRPLVTAALVNKNITSNQRIELFSIIEKCIFTWFRMAGYNNALYSVQQYNFARELLSNEIEIKRIIDFYNEKFYENIESCKKTFIERIKVYFNRNGYFQWKSIRYFLYEYEDYLYTKSQRKDWRPNDWRPAVKGYYSIEHIYPQTPTDEYWIEKFKGFSEERKRKYLGALGNLLLLSKDVNAQLQNVSYDKKCNPKNNERVGYGKGSYAEREVASNYAEWNPKTFIREV